MDAISNVAIHPASKTTTVGRTTFAAGTKDAVNIRVVIRGNRIVTCYPTNLPGESMAREMEDQRAGQEQVKEKLAQLRAMLSTGSGFNSWEVFDEFVREHEWGLALHVVCVYLLEPTAQGAP